MGLMNQGELTHRKMEISWDSDVNLEHALCFWLQRTVRFVCLSKMWLSLLIGLEKSKLVSFLLWFLNYFQIYQGIITDYFYLPSLSLLSLLCRGSLHGKIFQFIVIKRFCWLLQSHENNEEEIKEISCL